MHRADSLCCTAETNTALQSNYTPVKILKRKKVGTFLTLSSLAEAKGRQISRDDFIKI